MPLPYAYYRRHCKGCRTVWDSDVMETSAVRRLADAVRRYDAALAELEQARDARDAAIVAARRANVSQADVALQTGLLRERIRRIERKNGYTSR
jgi:hypothetical protein